MEITGTIIELLPEKTGETVKGIWRKQEYILETDGQYPKKICFMAWGDKIDQFAIKQGEGLMVSIDLESREYNGRWYTDVKAWKVARVDSSADSASSYARERREDTQSDELSILDDDIPF